MSRDRLISLAAKLENKYAILPPPMDSNPPTDPKKYTLTVDDIGGLEDSRSDLLQLMEDKKIDPVIKSSLHWIYKRIESILFKVGR